MREAHFLPCHPPVGAWEQVWAETVYLKVHGQGLTGGLSPPEQLPAASWQELV